MIKLFIGGFPLDSTELELVKLVGPYGDVSTIKIVRDKKTKICKGYAFLEMTDRAGAERVIGALDGYAMGDRQLSISIVEEKPAPRSISPKRPPADFSNAPKKRPRKIF